MRKPLCPLRGIECGNSCAWFNNEKERCAILELVENISDLNNTFIDITNNPFCDNHYKNINIRKI